MMQFCKFAQSIGKACPDGFSKRVLCAHDSSVHCLRDCMKSCTLYLPIGDELTKSPDVPAKRRSQKQLTVSQQQELGNQVKSIQNGIQTKNSSGCGSCGGNSQNSNYTDKGRNWSSDQRSW